MKKSLLILFIKILVIEETSFNNSNIIRNYLKINSIKYATIIVCANKKGKFTLVESLIPEMVPLSVYDIKHTNFQDKLKTENIHVGIIVFGDCPTTNAFLIECGLKNFFSFNYHWLIVLRTSKNLKELFKNVTININADINVAVLNKSIKEKYTIFDVYNPAASHGGNIYFIKIGYYDQKVSFNIENHKEKYFRRRNLTGVTFKSMIVLPAPFKGSLENYLENDDNRNINTFNRFHYRIMSYCRDYYNFSVNTTLVKSWGYKNPDGTFDGMVGALEHKVIDFGSSPLFFREDRAEVIDYGRNTWILRAAFLFRNPKTRTSLETFLHPFPSIVWIIILLISILSVVILKMVTTFERKKYHYNTETTWSISVIFTMGAFCQQGSPTTPRMTCGRITTISIFLLSVLIYQFYSASLVSHLLMKPYTKIKDLKDLLYSPLEAGCEDILYDRDYFKYTTDRIAREIYKRKIEGRKNTSNFLPPEQGLHLVEKGNFAYHVETATAYPIIEATFPDKIICELKEVSLFGTRMMHANYQKNSPFRDMFDTCLQRLAETGILYKERKHWHPRKPECIQSSRSTSFHVGLEEFYPALLILVAGIAASVSVLVVEKQIKLMRDKTELKMYKTNMIYYIK